jgi:beta-glucosidase
VPCHSNPYYVNEILKKELKFKGVVVSDWLEVIKLHTIHKVASTPKEAVRIAGSNY